MEQVGLRAKAHTDYEPQDAWGNSIPHLRNNLTLSPIERLRRADAMLRFVLRYKGKARARTKP